MKVSSESSRHDKGERIVTQTISYTLSDDLFSLSEMQGRYARIVKRIEELNAAESNDSVVRELERLSKDRVQIMLDIVAQQENVDGHKI